MDKYLEHKCIECKNKFYCYDMVPKNIYNHLNCLCYKQLMLFKTSVFSDFENREFVFCCSEQCYRDCIKESQKPINKYYIKRIKDNYKNFFKTSIEFMIFVCVIIYFYFLISLMIYIFRIMF